MSSRRPGTGLVRAEGPEEPKDGFAIMAKPNEDGSPDRFTKETAKIMDVGERSVQLSFERATGGKLKLAPIT